MDNEPKKISRDTYLKALALFTMSHYHMIKGYEFELELLRLLDFDEAKVGNGGHLSDEIYSSDERVDFDEAMKREGFTTETALESHE